MDEESEALKTQVGTTIRQQVRLQPGTAECSSRMCVPQNSFTGLQTLPKANHVTMDKSLNLGPLVLYLSAEPWGPHDLGAAFQKQHSRVLCSLSSLRDSTEQPCLPGHGHFGPPSSGQEAFFSPQWQRWFKMEDCGVSRLPGWWFFPFDLGGHGEG